MCVCVWGGSNPTWGHLFDFPSQERETKPFRCGFSINKIPFGQSSSIQSMKSRDLSRFALCKRDFSQSSLGSLKCMKEQSLADSDTVKPENTNIEGFGTGQLTRWKAIYIAVI